MNSEPRGELSERDPASRSAVIVEGGEPLKGFSVQCRSPKNVVYRAP